nr:Hypothetical protein [Raoultella ornithinolytica]
MEEALVSKLKIELSIYGYLRRDKGIKSKSIEKFIHHSCFIVNTNLHYPR